MRRAMAASGGAVHLIRYRDSAGQQVYTRTVQFVLFLALRKLWPNARAKMNCTVGKGLYIEVRNASDFCVEKFKQCVCEIIAEDIPLLRRRILTSDAIAHFIIDATGMHIHGK